MFKQANSDGPPRMAKTAAPAVRDRNVWSLFNSFTEALKEGSLAELPKRTEALHGLLEIHVGLTRYSAATKVAQKLDRNQGIQVVNGQQNVCPHGS